MDKMEDINRQKQQQPKLKTPHTSRAPDTKFQLEFQRTATEQEHDSTNEGQQNSIAATTEEGVIARDQFEMKRKRKPKLYNFLTKKLKRLGQEAGERRMTGEGTDGTVDGSAKSKLSLTIAEQAAHKCEDRLEYSVEIDAEEDTVADRSNQLWDRKPKPKKHKKASLKREVASLGKMGAVDLVREGKDRVEDGRVKKRAPRRNKWTRDESKQERERLERIEAWKRVERADGKDVDLMGVKN